MQIPINSWAINMEIGQIPKTNGPVSTEIKTGGWRHWITALGLDRGLRCWLGGCGAIVMLHRVKADHDTDWHGDPGLFTPLHQIAAIIETLRAEGYDLVNMDVALQRLALRRGPRFAVLTFDDGYRDNYELLALLQRLQAPATIYVTSGFIDGIMPDWWSALERILNQGGTALRLCLAGQHHCWPTADPAARTHAYRQACSLLRVATPAARLDALRALEQDHALPILSDSGQRMLSWAMLRELQTSGLIEVGAHTVSHPDLSTLSVIEAQTEIRQGRERLEAELRSPIRHFAYPYGDAQSVSSATIALARAAGFASAVLSYGGPVHARHDALALPRIPFGGADTVQHLRLRLTGLRRARNPLPASVDPGARIASDPLPTP